MPPPNLQPRRADCLRPVSSSIAGQAAGRAVTLEGASGRGCIFAGSSAGAAPGSGRKGSLLSPLLAHLSVQGISRGLS